MKTGSVLGERRRMAKRYIDTDEAIKAITDMPNCYNGFSDTYDKACIIGVLEELPSADVQEVRHGRWIKDKNLYKCTACNDLLAVAGWADCIPEKQIYKAFRYCPNCGARMDE